MNHETLNGWRKEGRHLPEFLRDFHDQKDLFKTIHEQYRLDDPKGGPDSINWVQAHIYTIGAFLWFMAAHGWTLQRNATKRVNFYSLEHTLNTARTARNAMDASEYPLRPDFLVQIVIPRDLTEQEAGRLCAFIKAMAQPQSVSEDQS